MFASFHNPQLFHDVPCLPFIRVQETRAPHEYWFSSNENDWFIRARACEKKITPPLPRRGQPVCRECLSLGNAHGPVRYVSKFFMKYWPAKLLAAMLFSNEAHVEELRREIRNSACYQRDREEVEEILGLKPSGLQQVLQQTCLTMGKDLRSDAFEDVGSVSDILSSSFIFGDFSCGFWFVQLCFSSGLLKF